MPVLSRCSKLINSPYRTKRLKRSNIESLSANEAKTHFGDLLLKVQRGPIQMNRNGKAVAVVISMADYLNLETIQMQQLKDHVAQAKEAIAAGHIIDGKAFFDNLLTGKFD